MNLDSLFSNPIIKKIALAKIKEVMAANDVSLITITVENGELAFNAYTEPMKVMSQKDFTETLSILNPKN
jgi:hypothetical protein